MTVAQCGIHSLQSNIIEILRSSVLRPEVELGDANTLSQNSYGDMSTVNATKRDGLTTLNVAPIFKCRPRVGCLPVEDAENEEHPVVHHRLEGLFPTDVHDRG